MAPKAIAVKDKKCIYGFLISLLSQWKMTLLDIERDGEGQREKERERERDR